MVITKTPFRLSFFGGGSDLAEFYHKSPGSVLSVSINQYMYIQTHKYFYEDQIRVKYSKTEDVKKVSDLQHPIVREVLQKFGIEGALEISSIADIPGGTGLGSSSAFTVGLIHNLYSRLGKYVTKNQLAEEACDIEIQRLHEPIGKQDQYAAACGGLQIYNFLPTEKVNTEKVLLTKDSYQDFQDHLLLVYTGKTRSASSVLSEQKQNIQAHSDKFSVLKEMVSLVEEGKAALYNHNLNEFGRLLDHGWMLKKKMATKISDTEIDDIYTIAKKNGAIGGKILGAGGGGFFLFLAEPQSHSQILSQLQLKKVDFKFEDEGSKVIYWGEE